MQFPGLMRDLGVTEHTVVRFDMHDGIYTSVQGTISPLHIDSDVKVDVRDFEVFDAGFDDPTRRTVMYIRQAWVRSKFNVRPNAIQFQDARIDFQNSHLNVFTSLGFDNHFRLIVSEGSTIELEDINPLLDIPWKGRVDLTVDIADNFDEPVIQSDIAIKDFEFAGMAFGEVKHANIVFRPMVMDILNVQAVKGGSAYEMPAMRIDFTGPTPVSVDARVQSASMDLRDFLSLFGFDKDPRFEGLSGVTAVNAQVHFEDEGPLDRCGGGWLGIHAEATARQLDLFGERFDSGSFVLDYEWFDRAAQEFGIRVDIPSVVLRKGDGTIVGQGAIRPGGILRARAVATNIPVSKLDALGATGLALDARVSATADVRGTLDSIEADVDARISPLRLGTAVLPSSWLAIHLAPIESPQRIIGRSQCGHPISAPFDPIAYAKDMPTGVFEVRGELFAGQVLVQDAHITRQSSKVVTGTIVARDLDIGKVAQVWTPMVGSDDIPQGVLSGTLDVRHLPLDALSRADVSLSLTSLEARSSVGSVRLREGTPPIRLQQDTLTVPQLSLDIQSPTGFTGAFVVGGEVRSLSDNPDLSLQAKLDPIDLSAIASMVPNVERARGRVEASIDVSGDWKAPRFQGQVSVGDGALSVRGFPMPIDGIDVVVRIDERQIALERATARLGGGSVSVVGTLPVEGFDFGTASATITARGVHLAVSDGINAAIDADLTASWNALLGKDTRNIPRVVGDVRLLSFDYTKPIHIEADIASIAERVRRTSIELYDPQQDFVDFDVQVHAQGPLRIRNNLADLRLLLDAPGLTLSGSNQRVGLRGGLRVQPGSRIRLRASNFDVRDGTVRFDDTTRITPILDVTAVTEYRRYSSGGAEAASAEVATPGVTSAGGQWRIQLHAHGDADNLRLDMTSEPALSQEDIVLLLMLGVTRAELDQMQASSIGETAALEALSALTGADSVVRESLPVIDEFRFGSAYSSRSGRTEPTVTVGKRITERVHANVTSGLSDTREVRSNLEWQLTGSSSILGGWDNVNNVSNSTLGNLGADIRFRLTFE